MKKTLCLLSLAALLPASYAVQRAVNVAAYDIVKRGEAPVLDGKPDENVWKGVPAIAGGFHFPWENREAPLTELRAYHDGTNFYFSFVVQDKDVVSVKDWQGESTVDKEDRVELFFAGGNVDRPGENGMERYYAVEVDPLGRAHDYAVEYYRHFDSEWKLPGFESAAALTEQGYSVEGKIPLASLNDLKLIRDGVMRAGAYRAEFSTGKDAGNPEMAWISWVNPDTAAPDFHVDASFGEFRFLP